MRKSDGDEHVLELSDQAAEADSDEEHVQKAREDRVARVSHRIENNNSLAIGRQKEQKS